MIRLKARTSVAEGMEDQAAAVACLCHVGLRTGIQLDEAPTAKGIRGLAQAKLVASMCNGEGVHMCVQEPGHDRLLIFIHAGD